MRQRPWLWVLAGFVLAVAGIMWYIGRFNSTHPAIWPMYGGGAGHRNYAAEPFPQEAKLLWKVPLGQAEHLSTMVVWQDGTVYFALDSKVVAVGPDGQRTWGWETGGRVYSLALGRRGTVYALTPTRLYALNPDGTQLWQVEVELGSTLYPLKVGQGGVIYATGDKRLYSIDSQGQVNWRFNGENITAGVAETAAGKLAVVVDTELYLLDRDGDTVWHQEAPNPQRERVVVAGPDDLLYVQGQMLDVWDNKGARVSERRTTSARAWNLAVGDSFVQHGLERFDLKLQTEQWPFLENPALPIYVLVDSTGQVLVHELMETRSPRRYGVMYLLDSKGKEVWRYPDMVPLAASAPGKGRLYVFGYDSRSEGYFLYAIGER